jgi:two-component sensor histidine kinase
MLLLRVKASVNPVATTMDHKTLTDSSASDFRPAPSAGESVIESLPPYLLYRSDTAFKPSYVSPNSTVLLGVAAENFVGNPSIWEQIIPECDRKKVFDKFKELDSSAEISCLHRILDGFGVPTWVSHRVTVVLDNGVPSLCGFIAPIAGNDLSHFLEPSTISSFIHKLGNHFQMLNLAFNSLRKGMDDAEDVNVLQEALDKSVIMTRAFSEYSQELAWVPAFEFLEVIDAAIKSSSSAFIDSRVEIQRDCDPRLNGLSISGDPYLLELAVRAIFENAIEATNKHGRIKIQISVNSPGGVPAGLKLSVSDNGTGIAVSNLSKVMLPFFSTKANHVGLGLSMALRFVEMHGGNLKIKSSIEKGTEVLILLPLKGNVQDACR